MTCPECQCDLVVARDDQGITIARCQNCGSEYDFEDLEEYEDNLNDLENLYDDDDAT